MLCGVFCDVSSTQRHLKESLDGCSGSPRVFVLCSRPFSSGCSWSVACDRSSSLGVCRFAARIELCVRDCVSTCSCLLPSPVPLRPRLEHPSPEGDKNIKIKLFTRTLIWTHTYIYTYRARRHTHTPGVHYESLQREGQRALLQQNPKSPFLWVVSKLQRWKEMHTEADREAQSDGAYELY